MGQASALSLAFALLCRASARCTPRETVLLQWVGLLTFLLRSCVRLGELPRQTALLWGPPGAYVQR